MASLPCPAALEEFVETQEGRRVFLRSWRPGTIRAIVAIVHDRGSDGGRYRQFAEALAARSFATYAIDLQGSGRSPGRPWRLRPTASDLGGTGAMMSVINRREQTRPVFLFGHGTGAAVACLHALRHADELDGIVCEGIVLESRLIARTLRMASAMAPACFRRTDAAPIRAWKRHHALANLSLPLLVLHGSRDPIARPSVSETLHACVGSGNKTLQVFEGYGHDLVNDRGHAIVRDKACQWIEAQLNSGTCRRRIGIEYVNE